MPMKTCLSESAFSPFPAWFPSLLYQHGTHDDQDFYGILQVLTAIGNFCIVSIAIGIVIEVIVMFPIQHRNYREGINNLLVLLIGGIPIAMPTVLSVTMAIGSHRLSQQVHLSSHFLTRMFLQVVGMDLEAWYCSSDRETLWLKAGCYYKAHDCH
jgi:hypothetical protein